MRVKNLYMNKLIKNNHRVAKVCDKSEEVIVGAIFVAYKGYTTDGNQFINEAICKGARTIITEHECSVPENVNLIVVDNAKKELAYIMSVLYKHLLNRLKIIGITGTNGKTTVTSILFQYLRYLKKSVVMFSSMGNYIDDEYYTTNNTTPGITNIYELIRKANFHNGYALIEISSQAIRELRIMGIKFDVVIITNVTHDHLDYHKNLSDYLFSKGLLLNQLRDANSMVILNHDSKYYNFYQNLTINHNVSFGSTSGDYHINIEKMDLLNTIFKITYFENEIKLITNLLGEYNTENIAAVFACLDVLKVDLKRFPTFLQNLPPINGRMNVSRWQNRTIVIDYAHTPEAVRKTLVMLSKLKPKRLLIVIGCGGNRDRLKRPLIGEYACEFGDIVYFTEDNSRNEPFEQIILDITQDLTSANYLVIEKRNGAIRQAVLDSNEEDIILLMGKGLEKTYVDVLARRMSDEEMIKEVIKDVNSTS